MAFELGDWIWLHLRKERFLIQRHSKLLPRGASPFQILKRINDNAYWLVLPLMFLIWIILMQIQICGQILLIKREMMRT